MEADDQRYCRTLRRRRRRTVDPCRPSWLPSGLPPLRDESVDLPWLLDDGRLQSPRIVVSGHQRTDSNRANGYAPSQVSRPVSHSCRVMGLLELRYEHDSSAIQHPRRSYVLSSNNEHVNSFALL